MAVGKNKRLTKGGKKGGLKKKAVDPFTKKDWYDVKAPIIFTNRNIGKTIVTRTTGTKLAADGLKGRVFEVCQADLQKDEEGSDTSYRKFKLKSVEVQGRNVLTAFHGMDLTSDKMRSMVRKFQTLIEAHVDAKTTDGYLLRMFTIGFTNRRQNQVKKTCYAQSSQIRAIRKKMTDIMTREITNNSIKELFAKLIPDSIADDITQATKSIYPLRDVYVRKIKVLKEPKFDIGKLLELHGEAASQAVGETGERMDRPDNYEPPVMDAV